MPNYNQPYQLYQPYQQNVVPAQQQIQNGGFVVVPSEDIVNTYPVAHGNCVTFKIEGQPIVMEKSMGFSQFESPKIKKFRLVEEREEEIKEATPENIAIDSIKEEIKAIWSELSALKEPKKPYSKKKEVANDTEHSGTDDK